MAPEQFEDEKIDHRVDIWTFGLLLHEMLTGDHPLPHEAPFKDVLAWIRGGSVSVPAGVPPDLGRLIERCVATRPDDRLQTMDDVLAQLPLKAPRSRAPMMVAGALAVALALAAAWWLAGGS